jgi:hypothetical protein
LRATPLDRGGLNPQVRPGDVISIRPAGSVLVDGCGQAGLVSGDPRSDGHRRGHRGRPRVLADRHHATVKRVLGGGEQRSIVVDLDAIARGEANIPITDGDVVRLRRRPAEGFRTACGQSPARSSTSVATCCCSERGTGGSERAHTFDRADGDRPAPRGVRRPVIDADVVDAALRHLRDYL